MAFLYIVNIFLFGILTHLILNKLLKNEIICYSAVPIIGMVAYASYVFFTGYFLGLNKIVLCLPILTVPFFIKYINESFSAGLKLGKEAFSGNSRFFLVCLFAISFFSLARIFGTRILNDSLVYHLYLPKQYVDMGRIFRVPFSEHALWPQLGEMFFTFALLFKNISAAKFFSFFVYILIGVYTYLLTKTLTGNKKLSFLSLVSILATPAFFFYAADTYVDLAITLFILATIYFLYKHYYEDNKIYLLIAAIACAGALSCKFTSIIAFMAVAAVIIFKSRSKNRSYDILFFIIVCAIFSSFWYVRSYVESGNPIFPFGYNLFGKGIPSGADIKEMSLLGRLVNANTGNDMGSGKTLINFIRLPFDLTFKGHLFGGEKLGFLFLTLLPFFAYAVLTDKKIRPIKYFMLIYAVMWFLLDQMNRFLFPLLPLYTSVAFLGLKKLWDNRAIVRIFYIFLVPLLVLQVAWSGYYFYQDFEYLFKGRTREAGLDYTYGLAKFLQSSNMDIGGKILFVGDNRVFYLPDTTIRENTFRNFTRYDKEADRIAFLKKYGIKYILINTDSSKQNRADYDPVLYFMQEVGKDLRSIGTYTNTYDFILTEVK